MSTLNGTSNDNKNITNKVNTSITDRALWIPMKIVQVYLSLIFILFVFGPWPWPIHNRILVNSYLIMAQMLILFGYFISVRKKRITVFVSELGISRYYSYNSKKMIKYLLIISFALFIPNYMSRAGLESFSIAQIYNAFIKGLVNPGEQYYLRLDLTDQLTTNTLLFVLTAVTAPFRWLFIPLSVVNWSRLSKGYKAGAVIFIILDTISWISIGTNKGIFDNVFIVGYALLIKVYYENINLRKVMKRKKTKLTAGLLSVTTLSMTVMYMTNAITSRVGTLNYYSSSANIYVNFNSPIISMTPAFLRNTLIILGSYATQGYYGLSLAMKETFTTTYGFGNSWFLLSVFKKLTGNDSLPFMTYPFKIIKYGWDPFVNWHSIYTWLASDFSFIGTLFIMIIIGYWFGEVWKSVLFQKNVFAIGLFILFMIMFMYFPANNQIFAYINTFAAFWGLFIFWLFSAKVKIRL